MNESELAAEQTLTDPNTPPPGLATPGAAPRDGGLAFGVADQRLVATLTDISDIVEYRQVTPIPRTKPWLRGVANIRGRLYAIVDLEAYLGFEVADADAQGKLMVVNRDDLGCAWLVRSIYGLRYFDDQSGDRDASGFDSRVRPYLSRTYRAAGQWWGVMDVQRVVDAHAFRDILDRP